MNQTVTLPLWLALLLWLFAAWAAFDRLLLPSVRWFLRRSTNRVLDELHARLQVEIRPFQRTKRDVLIDRLLYDPAVQRAAEQFSAAENMPRDLVMQRVERYAREIVPAFNAYAYFRIGYWLSRRIAESLYRVRIGYADQTAFDRVDRDATVVFVMNHRSNMDYVLVSYLAAEKTALSYAVGEWARIWPLQTLIRAMGAYFVRRNSHNPLYRRVLQRYVSMATAAGVTQAIYPEGGLSRDGRLRPARLGLLDYMLRGFDPAQRDLCFVPVAINYDRTLEDRTLLLDRAAPGEPSARRGGAARAVWLSLRFIGRNVRLRLQNRWYRFGYACVNFGEPLSLRAFLAERGVRLADADAAQRSAALGALGATLMNEIAAVIPVLPVSLVATVFVREPRREFSELTLKAEVVALIGELERAGAKLYLPRADQDYAITVGLRAMLLRRLVSERDGLYAAVAGQRGLLEYYANSIAHFLSPEAEAGVKK